MQISPDGRYVAYQFWDLGQDEVYVKRFPNGEGRWQVAPSGGRFPRWSRNGRELFYLKDDTLMAVGITSEPSLSVSPPRRLFSASFVELGYDVALDGQRFVMIRPADQEEDDHPGIAVVQNWFAEFQ